MRDHPKWGLRVTWDFDPVGVLHELWFLGRQVNLILDKELVHFKHRRGNQFYIRFLRSWYRAAGRYADWNRLSDKPGITREICKAYKRVSGLL